MDHEDTSRHQMTPVAWVALCLALAALAFFLWTEHRAHLLGWLPYLILLACPVLHIFMHGKHGHGGHDGGGDR